MLYLCTNTHTHTPVQTGKCSYFQLYVLACDRLENRFYTWHHMDWDFDRFICSSVLEVLISMLFVHRSANLDAVCMTEQINTRHPFY